MTVKPRQLPPAVTPKSTNETAASAYYKGFAITVKKTFGGVWADYDRADEQYNTRIPRETPIEAVQDAKREIDRILRMEVSEVTQ